MNFSNYHIDTLNEKLSQQKRNNPSYSLRAFSRDIGVHHATLSQVLRRKRPFPIKNALEVTKKLGLGPKEKTLFMESLLKSKTKLDQILVDEDDKRYILDESHYKVISEWEHFATLDLFEINDFHFTAENVARKLGISLHRSKVVLQNLLTSSLLRQDENNNYFPIFENIRTTEDIQNLAIKKGNHEALEIGAKKLDEIEVELRDFSSMTVAMDLEKLPEAKTIIREFRQKMAQLLRDGNKTEVYQLAIQLYPLTNLELIKWRKNENTI